MFPDCLNSEPPLSQKFLTPNRGIPKAIGREPIVNKLQTDEYHLRHYLASPECIIRRREALRAPCVVDDDDGGTVP